MFHYFSPFILSSKNCFPAKINPKNKNAPGGSIAINNGLYDDNITGILKNVPAPIISLILPKINSANVNPKPTLIPSIIE